MGGTVGYSSRELLTDKGYLYLLAPEKEGLRVLTHWKLTDLFKVFVDSEESRLRLILKSGEQLTSKDYISPHLKELTTQLQEQLSVIGLTMTG